MSQVLRCHREKIASYTTPGTAGTPIRDGCSAPSPRQSVLQTSSESRENKTADHTRNRSFRAARPKSFRQPFPERSPVFFHCEPPPAHRRTDRFVSPAEHHKVLA